MKLISKIVFCLCVQSLLWTSTPTTAASNKAQPPRILFISSYSPAFHSYFDQLNGFISGMREKGFERGSYILDVEFLDSKRFPYRDRAKRIHIDLAYKLRSLPNYDLVVTADDNALTFASERLNGLLGDANIVFLGVNNVKRAEAQNAEPRIVGVVEALSIGKNLSLAQQLFPAPGKVQVIVDDTRTGRANQRSLEDTLRQLPNLKVEIHSLGKITYEQLFSRLAKLPDTTPLMLASIFRDASGRTMTYRDFFTRLRSVYKGPVFSGQSSYIGKGTFGGSVVSHHEQGRAAAGLAAKILAGTSADELRVIVDSPNLFTFDHRELKRFGIDHTHLPFGSKIINRPPSIFDEYAHWVKGGAIIFLIQLLFIAALAINIRQRKAAENALRKAMEMAESASQAKTAFLGNMSHELRTPLNSIIGFSELIKSSALGPIGNPKYAEFVGDIHKSGTHLLKLINEVLDISKIEAGKMTLDESSVPVAPLAQDCIRVVTPLAEAANLNLRFTAQVQAINIQADGTKIKQVLINLLSNAIKFTEAGGAVDFEVRKSDDGTVQFIVRDSGVGMTPEGIAVAVSLFGQVEEHMTRKHEGTGLGLPLAKRLAELHGGDLRIQSAPGLGTTVTVELPADRVTQTSSKAA